MCLCVCVSMNNRVTLQMSHMHISHPEYMTSHVCNVCVCVCVCVCASVGNVCVSVCVCASVCNVCLCES